MVDHGLPVLLVGLRPGPGTVGAVPEHLEGAGLGHHLNLALLFEPNHLGDEQVDAVEDGRVAGHVEVVGHHADEEGRLTAVQVVDAVPVGHETDFADHVEVVLDDAPGRGEGAGP